MLSILICDDDQRFLSKVSSLIEKILEDTHIEGKIVHKATSPKELKKFVKNGGHANLYIMDINLSSTKETGIDLIKSILHDNPEIYVVFMTSYIDYISLSSQTKNNDFLLKHTLNYDILRRCIVSIYNRQYNSRTTNTLDYISVCSGSRTYNVRSSDIIMIECNPKSNTIIHTQKSHISCTDSLEIIYSKINNSNFIQCHKSYIINTSYIKDIDFDNKLINLESNHYCRIDNKYRNNLRGVTNHGGLN